MTRRLTLLLFGILCVVQLTLCAHLIGRWEIILRDGASFTFAIQPVDPTDAFRGRYVAIRLEHDTLDIEQPVAPRTYQPGQTAYVVLATNDSGFARFDRLLLEAPGDGIPFLKIKVQQVDEDAGFLPKDILRADALAQRILTSTDPASAALRENLTHNERESITNGLAGDATSPALASTMASLLNRMLYEQHVADRLVGQAKAVNVYIERGRVRQALVKAYPDLLAPAPAARITITHPFTRYYMPESLAPKAEAAYREHSRSQRADRTTITVRVLRGDGLIDNLWIGAQPITEHLRSAGDATP